MSDQHFNWISRLWPEVRNPEDGSSVEPGVRSGATTFWERCDSDVQGTRQSDYVDWSVNLNTDDSMASLKVWTMFRHSLVWEFCQSLQTTPDGLMRQAAVLGHRIWGQDRVVLAQHAHIRHLSNTLMCTIVFFPAGRPTGWLAALCCSHFYFSFIPLLHQVVRIMARFQVQHNQTE